MQPNNVYDGINWMTKTKRQMCLIRLFCFFRTDVRNHNIACLLLSCQIHLIVFSFRRPEYYSSSLLFGQVKNTNFPSIIEWKLTLTTRRLQESIGSRMGTETCVNAGVCSSRRASQLSLSVVLVTADELLTLFWPKFWNHPRKTCHIEMCLVLLNPENVLSSSITWWVRISIFSPLVVWIVCGHFQRRNEQINTVYIVRGVSRIEWKSRLEWWPW